MVSTGEMIKTFAKMNQLEFDGDLYDKNYPEHMKKTIY